MTRWKGGRLGVEALAVVVALTAACAPSVTDSCANDGGVCIEGLNGTTSADFCSPTVDAVYSTLPCPTSGRRWSCTVTLTGTDGKSYSYRDTYYSGDPPSGPCFRAGLAGACFPSTNCHWHVDTY